MSYSVQRTQSQYAILSDRLWLKLNRANTESVEKHDSKALDKAIEMVGDISISNSTKASLPLVLAQAC